MEYVFTKIIDFEYSAHCEVVCICNSNQNQNILNPTKKEVNYCVLKPSTVW